MLSQGILGWRGQRVAALGGGARATRAVGLLQVPSFPGVNGMWWDTEGSEDPKLLLQRWWQMAVCSRWLGVKVVATKQEVAAVDSSSF